MRRKRARTIYWVFMAASALMAVFGPRLQKVQALTALAFVPVSHPANRLSHLLAGPAAPPLDPASPDNPRELRSIAAENERLRHQLGVYQGQLEALQIIHRDRSSLGQDVMPLCSPLKVVGSDRDTLQVISAVHDTLEAGSPVLHYERGLAGIAGVIAAAMPPGAQVRLISDPHVKVEGVFRRYDEVADLWVTLETERPLIEGAGDGMCQVARYRKDNVKQAGLKVGDWAVLDDSSWRQELLHYRIGRVVAIEDIPDEPGFARVLIEPSADLRRVRELMVMAR